MKLSRCSSSPVLVRAAIVMIAALMAGELHAAGVNGTVRSASTNLPLQGMIVQAYGADGFPAATATTDSNGLYGLSLTAGKFRVLAYDNNGVYATAFANGADSFESTSLLTLGATDTAKIDFQLQTGGTISGTVRASGMATGGVVVAAYNTVSGTRRGWAATRTDPASLGTYSIVLPPGSYKLIAYDDFGTLGPLFYGNKLAFDTAPTVNVTASQTAAGIDFSLQQSARITGTVVDAASGNPISAATVYAYTTDGHQVRLATADAAGQFRMVLAAGSYRFVAADPTGTFAAAFAGASATFSKSTAFTFTAGQNPAPMSFRLDRAGIVRGHAVDRNGTALNSIQIAAYNLDGTPRTDTKTDASGAFSMSLPPGTFRIGAYDNNLVYATLFYSQAADFADGTTVSAAAGQITPGIDFTMSRAGHFTGAVKEIVTAAPVAGITVAAYDDDMGMISSALTDASGLYNLVVPAGTYRLVAWDSARVYANSFDGDAAHFEATAPRTIAADASQAVNFTMRRGTTITGKILSFGAPVSGIEVDALDVDGHHVAAGTSGDDGSFAIPVLPASYKLFAHDPQRRYFPTFFGAGTLGAATVIVVPASGSGSVTLSLTPANRRRAVTH